MVPLRVSSCLFWKIGLWLLWLALGFIPVCHLPFLAAIRPDVWAKQPSGSVASTSPELSCGDPKNFHHPQHSVVHPVRWVFSTSSTAPILGPPWTAAPRIPKKYGYGGYGSSIWPPTDPQNLLFSPMFICTICMTSFNFYCCQSYQHCDPTIQNIWQNGSDHPVIVELQPTGCFRQVEPLHDKQRDRR